MRIVCWNMRHAGSDSPAWSYLASLNPSVALLQEVVSVPADFARNSSIVARKGVQKSGREQNFSTVVITAHEIHEERILLSSEQWVNRLIEHFGGVFVECRLPSVSALSAPLEILSVHLPAWPIPSSRLAGIDVAPIKLHNNPDLWCTELLWDGLRGGRSQAPLVVGGDFNASETFDEGARGPRGNREFLARMKALGLTDALRFAQGRLTPTFRNTRDGKLVHQIDHMFLSSDLLSKLVRCVVGDADQVLGDGLSDHLPIIADLAFPE